MATQASEIETIIKNNIAEETARSTADLEKEIEIRTQAAIDRINGVYTSAVKTLEQLELTDAGIFDFFQKTNGNIRVYDKIAFNYEYNLELDVGGRRLGYDNQGIGRKTTPISLKPKKIYKIIVMAFETGNIEEPKEERK